MGSRKNTSPKYFSLCLHIDTATIVYNLGDCGMPKYFPSVVGFFVPGHNKIACNKILQVIIFSDNDCLGVPWPLPKLDLVPWMFLVLIFMVSNPIHGFKFSNCSGLHVMESTPTLTLICPFSLHA